MSQRQTADRRRAIGLLDLPNEILIDICTRLCPHCQIDNIVVAPFRVATTARSHQKLLSRLSMCCKRLRDIAQPILFHWFPNLDRQMWPLSFTRPLVFALAIVQRPDLADCVRALTLYTPFLDPEAQIDEARFAFMETRFREVEVVYRKVAAALGGRLAQRSSRGPPHFVNFQDLVMAISPKLTKLCLQRPFEYLHLEWSYNLPNLTYLAFPGASQQPFIHNNDDRAYHLYQARGLLRHCPNLQTIIAPDCVGDWQYVYWEWYRHQPWDVPLPSLRKLSTNGLTIHELERILQCCPMLQDLEFFDDDSVDPNFNEVLQPERHLIHVAATLKRLSYSTLGLTSSTAGPHVIHLEEAARFQLANYSSGSGMSFSSFSALEELEIEQYLLYGPIFPRTLQFNPDDDHSASLSTPEGFLSRLPSSLRVLRIGFAVYWSTLYRDLLALAEASVRFPKLEHVIVEATHRHLREDHQLLADALRKANVKLTIRSIYYWTGNRGLLPPRPGCPPHVYRVVFDG